MVTKRPVKAKRKPPGCKFSVSVFVIILLELSYSLRLLRSAVRRTLYDLYYLCVLASSDGEVHEKSEWTLREAYSVPCLQLCNPAPSCSNQG